MSIMDRPRPKHTRMYQGSPRIEADENGRKVVRKGPTDAEKEIASKTEAADNNAVSNKALEEIMQKHAVDRFELYQRHEKEYMEAAQKLKTNEPQSEAPAETQQGE